MTPKEKAIELVDKFNIPHPFQNLSKQCALIAVDELLGVLNQLTLEYEYWEEVKQEIEKL
jgi:hypothetical protein